MKSIPIALQTHYDLDATTTCLLCRIETKGGTVYGFTSLDADVVYDDGNGSVTYRADNGFTPERLQMTADLNVDNTDLQGWVSDTGITEPMIRAGLFDHARVRVYRVNYMNLANGHEIVQVGTCGETSFSRHGWKTEFRSLTQQLKQPISTLYSLKCRAKFGSKPIGTGGEQPESRFPCGKDWVWTGGTVTAVDGTEPDRIFTDTSNAQADGFYNLGVIEWLTGNNAGAQMEVDSQASDVFTQSLNLAYAIQVGDTYRVRQDCDKTKTMCINTHNNLVNFRGESMIPVADGGSLMVPGAHIRR